MRNGEVILGITLIWHNNYSWIFTGIKS